MKLYNTSPNRTCLHEDDGVIYRIDPLTLSDVPDHVAEMILHNWPDVSNDGPAKVNVSAEPWESKCGPQWELAKKEFSIDLSKPQKPSVGPDRPAVIEEAPPADAIDTETGKINEKLLNTHLCTYCQKEYQQITRLRTHMKKEHNV